MAVTCQLFRRSSYCQDPSNDWHRGDMPLYAILERNNRQYYIEYPITVTQSSLLPQFSGDL